MNVRIFDVIPHDIGAYDPREPITSGTPLYNPNNLGGGFSRDETGRLSLNNENISFQMIFKTDVNSTGYEKYLQVVNTIAQHELVWLRYGVPGFGGYVFAYRPGYVSSITKTEGKYSEA